jgi:hypothetical protein
MRPSQVMGWIGAKTGRRKIKDAYELAFFYETREQEWSFEHGTQ